MIFFLKIVGNIFWLSLCEHFSKINNILTGIFFFFLGNRNALISHSYPKIMTGMDFWTQIPYRIIQPWIIMLQGLIIRGDY